MSDDMQPIGSFLPTRSRPWPEPKPLTQPEIDARVRDHWQQQCGQMKQHLLNLGAPEAAVNVVAAGQLERRPAIEAVDEWIETRKLFLVLLGTNFVGKSLAAVYAMSRRSVFKRTQFGEEPWIVYHYLDGSQFYVAAREVGATKGSNFDSESYQLLRRMRETRMLVLDDIGQQWKDIRAQTEDLLAYRWSKGRKTIITANLDVDQFKEAVGERAVTRIRADGLVKECELTVRQPPPQQQLWGTDRAAGESDK